MLKENKGDFKASYKSFQDNLSKFKRGKNRNYDILVKAGEKFHISVFKICEKLFEK